MGAITQILVALDVSPALRFDAGSDENCWPKRNSMVKRMILSGLMGLFWSSTTIPAETSALAVLGPTTGSKQRRVSPCCLSWPTGPACLSDTVKPLATRYIYM